MDEKKLFLCEVNHAMPHDDEIREALESAARCHEHLLEDDAEVAWDETIASVIPRRFATLVEPRWSISAA